MEENQKVIISLKNGKKFTGFIIPKDESSNKKMIVLKLGNGYNVGISSSKIKNIKKLEKTKSRPLPTLSMKGRGPKVTIIGTGGTVSSRVDYITGGVEASMNTDEILNFVPESLQFAELNFVNLFNKLSEDFTPKNWQTIARKIHNSLKKSEGVVILHGTDTMHYTASMMSLMIDTSKPIVFTGAQRSSDRPSTDSFLNILSSIHAAKSNIPESLICFHSSTSDNYNHIIRGNRSRKMHTSSRNAFLSINTPPLANIWPDGKLEKTNECLEPQKPRLRENLEEKVAIVKVFPGSDPKILNHFANAKYKGIVIEGTGLGHVPTNPDNGKSWVEAIDNLKNEIKFVITSQTIFGRTHKNVYTNLRKLSRLGVSYVEDMTTETAYTKLMWALGNFKQDKIKEIMEKNLKGEMSSRTLLKDMSQHNLGY